MPLTPCPGELPAEVTGFVGRQAELTALSSLLRTARLITITGPGGVGKTRIALRAAKLAANRFVDGVYLAELASLHDPELLPHTIAACLGLPKQDVLPPLETVLDFLHRRRVLLILDTCEHLVDACAAFAAIVLRTTATVTVLATSRQPLDADGEHTRAIPPLPVPEPDAPDAGRGDAVELFAQRAAEAAPGFTLTSANLGEVIRLCQWLDGIPLAIELTAVRLRAVPLRELTGRLTDRFTPLAGQRRGTLPQHQTMRNAIGWSYDLCTPAQQLLWTRLSVFAGTFGITDAELVCAGDPLGSADVLQALIDLVDRSVVLPAHAEVTGGGLARYRLLDTIREFGAEKLAASGEETTLRIRHIKHYTAMARYFGANPVGEDQLDRYRELRAAHDNIRTALENAFAIDGMDAEAASLATELYAYWQISGLLSEGRYWLAKVLDRFPGPSPERAWALVMTGIVAIFQGQIGDALAAIDEGIAMADSLGEQLTAARGYGHRTLAYGMSGKLDEAAAAGRVALTRAQALDDFPGLVALDAEMTMVYLQAGDAVHALERAATGLGRLPEESAERWMQGWLNYCTGFAQLLLGSLDDSAAALGTALAMNHELGERVTMAYCLEALGWLAATREQHDRAAWLLGAADPLWQRAGRRLSGDANLEQFHQRAVKTACETLGDQAYTSLFDQGAHETLDRVVEFATASPATTGLTGAGPVSMVPVSMVPASTGPTDAVLTRRERQIAELVADGLSNREIADHLVISKRTVDAHLDHIFGKLELSSRVQLATWLKSHPLGEVPRLAFTGTGRCAGRGGE
jgi:predicted ATPase/DNA-binding CsgD family transcriptional regulator